MTAPTVIKNYHMAENDQGKVLLVFPDLGAEAKEATYALEGTDLVLHYPDHRHIKLPEVPAAMRPTLQTAKVILIAENTNSGLARAYEARNSFVPPTKRPRARL